MKTGVAERVPEAPDFVVAGHITEDVTASGRRLGGVPSYAAAVVAALGVSVGVVTRCAPSLDLSRLPNGVQVAGHNAACTTVMEHRHPNLARSLATPITPDDVPFSWRRAPVALLGPVIGEIEPSLAAVFPAALIGATAQGWLRRVDEQGVISAGHVEDLHTAEFGGRITLFALSEEDLEGAPLPHSWFDAFPIVIVTAAGRGLQIWHEHRWWTMPAFETREVDPTGAGDALTAAFLVRYSESGDVGEAARFGAAAASFVVEHAGIEAAAGRKAIERRLAESPGIRLIPA